MNRGTALRIRVWGVAVLACLALGTRTHAHQDATASDRAKPPARVFVLNSYHLGEPFADTPRLGMMDAFTEAGRRVEMFVEHLDANHLVQTPEYLDGLAALIRHKYAALRFDVIVASDDDALQFLRARRETLFPGVPLVFLGIEDLGPGGRDPRSTGIGGHPDRLGSVITVLRVLPGVTRIVAVVDGTTTGRAERAAVDALGPLVPVGVTLETLSLADLTLAELADRLGALPADTAVLLLSASVDRDGTVFSPSDTTPLLARRAPVPVFVISDVRVGLGAIGGLVGDARAAGRVAGSMALAIIDGTDPATIPMVRGTPARYVFDHTVLTRFGVPATSLPGDATVINRPPSILDQFRTQVISALVVMGTLTLLLVFLGVEILRRRRVEVRLRTSQSALATVLDSVPQGVFWKDLEGRYLGCNQVFATTTGHTHPAEVVGKTDDTLSWSPEAARQYREDDREVAARGVPKRHIIETLRTADGSERWIDTSKVPLRDDRGDVYAVLGIYDDISDRRKAETEHERLVGQLQQAAKMEAVGRLAGGIAHDFNNLLTAISGNIELARDDAGSPDLVADHLTEAAEAADRAATLTRQLLAFSRKQMIEPRVTDLNSLVRHLERMLARLIGEDIALKTILAPALGAVKVDPGQMEQALVNLAVNARDAMPDGGTLLIETGNVYLDDEYVATHAQVTPGPFVLVAVTDSGSGMSDEVKRHVFEPFYTTKDRGRGTGLGLAMTFGAVTQVGGHIEVYSEPGLGTTFKIYLPLIDDVVRDDHETPLSTTTGGAESILLVEDDAAVLHVAEGLLRKLGYRVRGAASGADALRLVDEAEEPFDLLITDVVMPGMNGRDLARQLASTRPNLKVLFASGYTENVIVHRGLVEEHLHFIPKPYSGDALAVKIRQALAAPQAV